MPDPIDAAREQVRILRWVVNQARDRAIVDPPLEIMMQLKIDTELATPADVRRGVERIFDELDSQIAQVSFLLIVQAFEAHVTETLKSVADEMRLVQREGRSIPAAMLREGLVRGLADLRSLGRISDIVAPLVPDRRSDLQVIIKQRNRIAHGAERSEALSVTADQAFDVLSAVAMACRSAADDAPEKPETAEI